MFYVVHLPGNKTKRFDTEKELKNFEQDYELLILERKTFNTEEEYNEYQSRISDEENEPNQGKTGIPVTLADTIAKIKADKDQDQR